MGCADTLLHGEDIALGPGPTLDVSREVSAQVLSRLLRHEAAVDLTTADLAGGGTRPAASLTRAGYGFRARPPTSVW
jgi:hypothetical protein